MVDPHQQPLGATSAPREEATDRIRGIVLAVLVALMCVAIAYVVGRLQGSAATAVVQEELDEATEARERDTSKNEEQIAKLEGRLALLEARRQLHRALMELDARNFGIAQEHLEKAAAKLAETELSTPELKEAHAGLTGLRLVATEDVSNERTRVQTVAKTLDEIIEARAAAADRAQ